MQLVYGEIPYFQERLQTGRFLVPNSFLVRSGLAVASWNHWRDNDELFGNQVMWAATGSGLKFAHVLNDEIPFEKSILERVKRQELFFSYGDGARPGDTRQAITAGNNRHIPYARKPLERVTFAHVSYVPLAAFPQQPIRWVGIDL